MQHYLKLKSQKGQQKVNDEDLSDDGSYLDFKPFLTLRESTRF